jgi:ubiquinone/menaquinone biosynthesis C-methylase UbiE
MKTVYKKEIVSAQMQITSDVIGAWKSQILFTLNNLGVFESLVGEIKSAKILADALKLPEKSLSRLLDAGVSAGYLQKKEKQYTNSPVINTIIQPEKDGYLGNWLKMYAHWYTTFGKLENAVRTGKAVEDANSLDDASYNKLFIQGMSDYANYRGRDLLNYLDLNSVKHLLDVGCGPGIYAAMFCKQYPGLTCTCYDVPQALELAQKHLQQEKVIDNIRFKSGDYLKDESFGENKYEVVFLSHVLHQESPTICQRIIQKAYNALTLGGILVIQAMFLNENKTGPLYASLHDLLTLLIFPEGKNYTYEETAHFLKNSGFINIRKRKMSLFNVNSLVLGEKGEL